MLPIASAVHAAHEAGVVHRDLKPSNIFLTRRDGKVAPIILDFGISKLVGDVGRDLTASEVLLGTVHFMSPEQTRGGPSLARCSGHRDRWNSGGANDFGQLGDRVARGVDVPNPTRIVLPLDAGAKDIAVADSHACALLEGDTVVCWGDNSASQLGRGQGAVASGPTPANVLNLRARTDGASYVTSLSGVGQIAAGGRTTCANGVVRISHRVWCWGANEFGQAGQPADASIVPYASPVAW